MGYPYTVKLNIHITIQRLGLEENKI